MKKIKLIITTIFAGLLLQACDNGRDKNGILKSDVYDITFVTKSSITSLHMIALSNAALKKSTNSKVKDFATMMSADHTDYFRQLINLSIEKKYTMPNKLNPDVNKGVAELERKNGNDFDKAYINQMVEEYKNDLPLFEDGAKNITDTNIKKIAVNTLPGLKSHMVILNSVQESLK